MSRILTRMCMPRFVFEMGEGRSNTDSQRFFDQFSERCLPPYDVLYDLGTLTRRKHPVQWTCPISVDT